MSRKRGLNKCPACLTIAECQYLTSLGRKVREPFRDRDGRLCPGVVVRSVLCWWCRERHSPDEVEKCMAIERPAALKGGGSTSCSTAKMPPWLSQYPELWEFLSKPSYRDGTPRQLGKISLGWSSDGIQVTLTDPSSSGYCSRHYPSLDDALGALEIGLVDQSLSWRASGPPKGKRRA